VVEGMNGGGVVEFVEGNENKRSQRLRERW